MFNQDADNERDKQTYFQFRSGIGKDGQVYFPFIADEEISKLERLEAIGDDNKTAWGEGRGGQLSFPFMNKKERIFTPKYAIAVPFNNRKIVRLDLFNENKAYLGFTTINNGSFGINPDGPRVYQITDGKYEQSKELVLIDELRNGQELAIRHNLESYFIKITAWHPRYGKLRMPELDPTTIKCIIEFYVERLMNGLPPNGKQKHSKQAAKSPKAKLE